MIQAQFTIQAQFYTQLFFYLATVQKEEKLVQIIYFVDGIG